MEGGVGLHVVPDHIAQRDRRQRVVLGQLVHHVLVRAVTPLLVEGEREVVLDQPRDARRRCRASPLRLLAPTRLLRPALWRHHRPVRVGVHHHDGGRVWVAQQLAEHALDGRPSLVALVEALLVGRAAHVGGGLEEDQVGVPGHVQPQAVLHVVGRHRRHRRVEVRDVHAREAALEPVLHLLVEEAALVGPHEARAAGADRAAHHADGDVPPLPELGEEAAQPLEVAVVRLRALHLGDGERLRHVVAHEALRREELARERRDVRGQR